MKTTLTCLALIVTALSSGAAIPNNIRDLHLADANYDNNILTSSGTSTAKSDTIYLLGGPNLGTGKFQEDSNPGLPDREGWIGVDITAKTAELWHIDTYMAPMGGNAIWCGEVFASCGGSDTPEGYGNSYQEYLDWTGVVTDNSIATSVTLEFDLNYDNEPGYDYLYVKHEGAIGMTIVATYNGTGTGLHPMISFTITPTDYVGTDNDEVHLRFEATSDGAWSDQDCLWPTNGHSQVDNISVSGTNGLISTFDDFESGMPGSNWQLAFPLSVGDFSKVWPNLNSLDPCTRNPSPQFAFIDDGIVVPCTNGTLGTTWTYGPGGFTHNLTGGCAGQGYHTENEIWSPVLDWANESGQPLGDTYNGAIFSFDVFDHLPIGNGMFYVWNIRSMDDSGTWSEWRSRNFVYYGSMSFVRRSHNITDLLVTSPAKIQLSLGIHEYGWVWGLWGVDGTPAPYFDNVALAAYQIQGPSISTRELEMAQDGFPAIGSIDYVNLGNNSIRFDMATDINGSLHPAIMPGDSITYSISSTAPGGVLSSLPMLHYTINPNPLFNSVRSVPTSGTAVGDSVRTSTGVLIPDRYSFDLPDTGMLFPGDVMHYYISAEDVVNGTVFTSTLPDTPAANGYGVFPGSFDYIPFVWPSSNIVRGLPTMFSSTPGDQPPILFYQDFGGRSGENEWIWALRNLGYYQSQHYDIYYTNSPTSGVSNGLGAKATLSQIDGYDIMLYSSGDLTSYSLTPNDQDSDKSDDISLLTSWLSLGNNLLATGDNLVSDLVTHSGVAGAEFVSTWLGVEYLSYDISRLIGYQAAPMVVHVADNSVDLNSNFIAYGACPYFKTFDEVSATTAEEIAEWTDFSLLPVSDSVTTAAAGFLNVEPSSGSDVIYFPVDFMSWYTPQEYVSPSGMPFAARVEALDTVLRHFGSIGLGGTAVGSPPALFSAQNAPNPFNPTTEIKWTIPRAGDLSIKVFNVRGELITTLKDGPVEALAGTEFWRGQNDRGAQVASGVYFYEVRSGDHVIVNKMTLLK